MFNSLEDKDLETVIDAFFEVKLSPGEFAINQGEEGDAIYLVEKGELECNKVFKEGDPPTFLKNYEPGESFGELALLYNCPRAANIIAKTDCVLWGLDRQTFNYIVKDSAIKKREKYENTLKSVSIFSTLDNYELSQICDAIKVENFEKGKTVIRQNEKGDKFYILDEGECYASIIFSHNEEPIKVKEYQKGDYFGERALIKNEPRAATIVTKSNCKFLVLDRFAFKRLLGNINTILQRNIVLYEQYNEKIKNKK
jgi:cAMP-dependent protein kinase regulator